MARFDLETAIAAWRASYEYSDVLTEQDLDEMERHIRDQVDAALARDIDREDAFRQAIRDIGGRVLMESEYRKVYWAKKARTGSLGKEIRHRFDLARNYVVVAMRNLRRYAVISGINLFGLSISIASALTVYLFLVNYTSMGEAHLEADRTYLVGHRVERGGQVERWGKVPSAFSPDLLGSISGIEQSGRLRWGSATVRIPSGTFDELIAYVDPSFLDVLTFPLASGNPGVLTRNDSVILSHSTAERLFGEADPVGRTLSLSIDSGRRVEVTVRGVAEPFPDNTAIRWSILAPWSAQSQHVISGWDSFTSGAIVRLGDSVDPEDVSSQLNEYVNQQRASNEEWQVESFFLDNLKEPVSGAWRIKQRLMEAPHPALIAMMLAIPLVMLLLSCFNYVNIAIGVAERRMREIGVRKVVGGRRGQLVLQFLTENIALTAMATLIGVVLAAVVFIPGFNGIFVYQITELTLTEPGFWLFIAGAIIVVSLVSGMYPALYISRFKPTVIFRGVTGLGGRRWFTRMFLGAQLVLVFITAILSIYLARGQEHFKSRDWGYDPSRTVVIRLHDSASYSALRDRLISRTEVESVAGAVDHVGAGLGRADLMVEGRDMTAVRGDVSTGYFDAMGIGRVAGRTFEVGYAGDLQGTAVVNQTFVHRAGWSAPLGKSFKQGEQSFTVAGVVQDVVEHPMLETRPAFFVRVPEDSSALAVVRLSGHDAAAGKQLAESVWSTLYPNEPADVFRQDKLFDIHLQSFENVTQALSLLSVLALIIACSGLYGLASQGFLARRKEMGIRKVLGAGAARLAWRANRRYVVLVTIAAGIAIPFCYAAIRFALQQFDTAFPSVGAGPFIASYVLILSIAFAAVARHTIALVRVQPAETLRN